jgi:catechol 2,3-dioxygenase
MTAQHDAAPPLVLGPVRLTVRDLARSLAFYTEWVGLRVLAEEGARADLGVADAPLLQLEQSPELAPPAGTGLYHAAFLLPSREDLATWWAHFQRSGQRLGQADHLVSEALYIHDPDGHGIEIYRDRPRAEWTWSEGQVRMASDPLNPQLIDLARPDWSGLGEQTELGHLHFRVSDLAATEHFYRDLMGFAVVARWPGALFVSLGGYHHHLGLNVWQSLHAPPVQADRLGLVSAGLRLRPDHLAGLLSRLEREGWPLARAGDDLLLRDPAGILLRVAAL